VLRVRILTGRSAFGAEASVLASRGLLTFSSAYSYEGAVNVT